MSLKKMVGDLIRARREKLKWTQEYLAAEISVTPATIRNYEKARFFPKMGALAMLAATLDFSVDEIIMLWKREKVRTAKANYGKIVMPPKE